MEWNYKTIIYQPTVRKHLSILFIGFGLGTLLYSFVKFNDYQNNIELYLSGVLGVFVCYAIDFSNTKLNQFISYKKLPGLRILSGIFWNLILSFLIVVFGFWAYSKLMNHQFSFETEYSLFIKIGILLFCATLLYNVVYFALYSYAYLFVIV